MVKGFLGTVCSRAWRSAVHHLIGETLSHRIAAALFAVAALALPYAYVRWFNEASSEFSDAIQATALAAGSLLIVGVLWFVIHAIFVAPYQLWKEQRERADLAQRALGSTSNRDASIYAEELSRERAKVQAKAQLMRDRLATRNHSYGSPQYDSPSTLSYLAGLWEAEEAGHFYDEYHRSTFMPMGKGAPRDLPGDNIAELKRNVIAYNEKRRQANVEYQRKRRRELIAKGRDLAQEFTDSEQSETFRKFLEGQRIYADIRPHLSEEYRKKLDAARMTYADPDGAKYPSLVQWFLDELDRLEKEWRLI